MGYKMWMVLLTLALAVLPLAQGGSPVQAADKPIEISLAHFWPPSHFLHTEQVMGWQKELEAACQGKVKIVTYPGQTLLKMQGIYDGVLDGVADIGIGVFALSYGRYPLMEIFELPALNYSNATAAAVVAWEGYKSIPALKIEDTKLLYLFCTGPGAIWSTFPIRNLDDLKGKEIMATSSTAVIMKKLGAVPIALPRPETYMAIKKGIVKGSVGPVEVLKGFKEAEVVDYVTPVNGLYNKVFYVVMNKDKFNSLPQDVQAAFDKVNDTWPEKAGKIWSSHMQEGLDFATQKHGVEIIQLAKDEHAKWMKLLQPIQDDFIENLEKKGLPGKATVKTVIDLCNKYSASYK